MSTQSSRGLPQLIMWSPIQSSLGLPLSNHVVCHAVITWPLIVITWFPTVIMWPPTQSSCGLPRSNHMPPHTVFAWSLMQSSHGLTVVITWPYTGHHVTSHIVITWHSMAGSLQLRGFCMVTAGDIFTCPTGGLGSRH